MLSAQDKEEKKILRSRLSKMGISSSPNTSLEKLRAKYAEISSGNTTPTTESPSVESTASIAARIRKDATKLIRVRIKNLNPYTQDLHGEIFTVANEVIGKVSKYVPYDDAGEAYHIPNCIYKMLLNKKFLQVKTFIDPATKKRTVQQSWVPSFSIEVLPQLTVDELKELARKQEAAARLEAS